MSLVTEEIRAKASEIYYGNDMCQEKSKFLLKEVGLPNGLLPLEDMVECGYVKDTGFVWLKQKKKTEHKFEKIGRLTSYATEVTAYVEPNKIKKLTGVKTRELLIWIPLSQIYVDDPPSGKITFQTPAGLSKSFPVAAFEVEEPAKPKEVEEPAKPKEVKEVVKEASGPVTVAVAQEVKEV
ncbi:Flap endonuclease [Actinidia chinensis var. chinensis]|uniref:Flap endonuclease n=1 Tax=Actinidia chinensis var. chinensis TaxID=1590841 RepID=A0A2R6R150_ACTCC|nr:Flap endonuclease [Actinidia chinensis var. chinensis]